MLALVTGGNRGIGLETCRALAQRGIKVLLGSRDKELGVKAAIELRALDLEVIPIAIDLRSIKSIQRAAKEISTTFGALDILINNAAVLFEGSVLDISLEKMSETLDVNLMGPIHCIRYFAPSMIEKNYGRIVNVSSGSGSFDEGLEGSFIYSVSKAALNAVTVKASQTFPPNVKINSVCPGWVRTRMGGDLAPRSIEKGAETIIWLATLPNDGPTGKFFRDFHQIQW